MRYGLKIPILYLILGVLVLVSVVPMYFYATHVIDRSRDQLKVNEQLLENELTRSLAEDIGQRQKNLQTMLANFATAVEVATNGNLSGNEIDTPQLRALLEKFVASSNDMAYVSLLNAESKGIQAGRVQMDVFMQKEMERAFAAAREHRAYTGQSLTCGTGANARTLMLVSAPLVMNGNFVGMVGVFEDLQFLVDRLRVNSIGGLLAYAVDRRGRLVAAPTTEFATGQDMTGMEIVKNFVDQGGKVRFAPTLDFTANEGKHRTRMLGTYAVVPSLDWAVVAQKSQRDAYQAVDELTWQARKLGIAAVLVSMLISILAARNITRPLEMLAKSSDAISQGDFSQRVDVRSRTEIGQLASTFNRMAERLEKYVSDLKHAVEENRTLFLSSIQMLAGAVDEKDPYTRGHSDRVTRFSISIAEEMGLRSEEIEKLRVAAQLHDVGKIFIEDRVLKKKDTLTPQEFDIMKAHTSKGANILRPVHQLVDMIPGIELHHERLDGGGYPYGRKGKEIPMMARIIMVADTYDAMTTDRPYQTARPPEFAVQKIVELANTKFDPTVVEALTKVFERGDLAPVPEADAVEVC